MSNLLRFHDYNPSWENDFNTIETFLYKLLKDIQVKIHHVGSTSVKGLGAKPIIDIDIEYFDDFTIIKDILTSNGYIYEGEKGIENRYSFKDTVNKHYQHHLYVIKENTSELIRHLSFRNALRDNLFNRKMYHNLKKQLIMTNNVDRELYTSSKTKLIEKILKEADYMKTIVFAGGCFWGVEAYFKQITGVTNTEVGYIAGPGATNYQEVCGGIGHAEAVLIEYNNDLVKLPKLMDHLFNIIDPTSINKQGPDIGVQYRSGIYNYNESDLTIINEYIQKRAPEYRRDIAIELKNDQQFYSAEENHQDYLDKNKHGYCHVKLDSVKDVE